MAARAAMAWEASLDPELVARLARPMQRPGLVSLAIVRRIHGGIDALLGRLSLLARFAHKIRELAAPGTPIVHAHGIGSTIAAAAVAEASAPLLPAPVVPIVRGSERTIERTIVVEKGSGAAPGRALDSQPRARPSSEASTTRETHETHETHETYETHVAREQIERFERTALIERTARSERIERTARNERIESSAAAPVQGTPGRGTPAQETPVRGTRVSLAAPEPIDQTTSAARRSRMGAPIVRRMAEPRELPVLVERAGPAPREIAEAPVAASIAANVASPVVLPSAHTADRVEVVVARYVVTSPGAAAIVHAAVPIVHAAASRAPAAPFAVSAVSPVTPASSVSPVTPAVLPRARAARPELAPPLAHAAPHVQAPSTEAARAVPATVGRAAIPLPAAHRELVAPPPSPSPSPKLDLHELADRVQHILARRALQERERRGLPR